MKKLFYGIVGAGILAAALVLGFGSSPSERLPSTRIIPSRHPAPSAPATAIGFRSGDRLAEHFAKHGAEFGRITKEEYLRAAQELRDRPAGGSVLEIVRDDGTVSRFDRESGAFLAFNRDRTIRTFFKPNDGESYFRRQAQRSH